MPLEPARPWQGARVLLGVTGGVAAYKTVQVARDLTRLGASVDVVMSRGARRFVQPLTFEAVSGRPVRTDLFEGGAGTGGAALHITLGREADVVCVAPATADFLARAAQGRGDDLLCVALLVTRAPVVVVPAMNDAMWSHPQVQANTRHVREALGYRVVGPTTGPLAAGEGEGAGRMVEPAAIVQHVGRALAEDPRLLGRRVLVTAGPTREALDAVRYVGNRSSGRMGYALAAAAWRRGAEVTLISGPSALPDPVGVEAIRVESARDMAGVVTEHIGRADLVVFAAAVADYRPVDAAREKVKRSAQGPRWGVELEANPDVALDTRSARKPGAVVVGFALETADLVANARSKLEAKGFDLIVANPAGRPGAGFESPTNDVQILSREGSHERLPRASKERVAEEILDRALALLPGPAG